MREYNSAIDADPDNYLIDGRQAAPTNVIFVYMMAVMYRLYPPQQGGGYPPQQGGGGWQ